MATLPRPRAVRILGHPVAGLAPILFLSAGWLLLALHIAPYVRDSFASVILAGGRPGFSDVWPPPPRLLLTAIATGGLLAIGLAMTVVWIRSAGGFGPLSDVLLSRSESLAGIVLIGSGVLSAALLSRGDPSFEDTKTHVVRGWLWFDSFRAGTFPKWTDLWYGGTPADQQSPPLAHILQGLLGFLRFGPFTAAKALAWICRVAGAVGFALFCARVHKDQRAGLLGGTLYALSPAIHAAWIWDGRLPAVLLLAIVPWAILAVERIATGIGGVRAGCALALATGAIALAYGTQARVALLLLAVFFLLRAIPTLATRGSRAPSVAGLLIGLLGGAALAAAFIVPAWRESANVIGIGQGSLTGFTFGFPDLRRIGDETHWNPLGRGYIGITVIILAIGGIVRAALDRREGGRGIGPIPLAIFALLPFCLSTPEERGLDLIVVPAMMAAAGVGRRAPETTSNQFVRRGLYPIAMLLILVDLAVINLVTTYGSQRAEQERIYEGLQNRMVSGRFLELPADRDGIPTPSHRYFAPDRPVPSVGGPCPQGAPRPFLFASAMIDTVAHAIASERPVPDDIVRLLGIHNVEYVLLTTPRGPVLPRKAAGAGFTVDSTLNAFHVEGTSPVAILPGDFPKGPAEPAGEFSPRRGLPLHVSRRLAADEMAWIRAANPKFVEGARAVVLPNRMEIDLPDVGPATIRIARNSYPLTEVRVDGQIYSWRPGPLGGILLDLPKGPHKIEIRATEDRTRRTCRLAGLSLAALLFLVAVGPRVR
jgi:hypothetical protein